jgi:hypothetical protein
LTKPDRIPSGEEKGWIDFIRNEREPLENNWYCVKQPSSSDLKQELTWHDARRREEEYFAGTSPWNELDSVFHKYLRTRNLVDRLSSVLSDLIAKRYEFPLNPVIQPLISLVVGCLKSKRSSRRAYSKRE